MKIGFIGLGNMGAAIATNLNEGGPCRSRCGNRSPEPVQAPSGQGRHRRTDAAGRAGG